MAPGTAGTAVAVVIGVLAAQVVHPLIVAFCAIPLFFIGVWACDVTGRDLGVADHGAMVWDEIVAFLLVLAIVPRDLAWQAAAFVLFRAFDIGKPPPIDAFERRFRGGFGVMFDDIIAAGYTLFSLALVQRLAG